MTMPIRLLHVIVTVNPEYGGPIEGVRQMYPAHRFIGVEVEIVSLDDPDDPWVKDCPIKCHAVGPGIGTYHFSKKLVPWIKAHAPSFDAVVVNGIWNYASFGAWCALHNSTIPYFVYLHGMLDPYFKKRYPLKHLKKYLYWPWAEYRVLRDAKAVFFTCEDERILARRSFVPYRCREHVVNYGTAGAIGNADAQRDLFFEKFPGLRGKRILLFLGRVHEKKGVDITLKAFAECMRDTRTDRMADAHLIVAGPDDSEYARGVKQLSQELGVAGRVTWTGMLRGDLKWGAFHASDAFVLNSHQENFGISVVEALSANLPVLITDKVNIWREIHQSRAGFVENDDLGGAIRLLRRWISVPQPEWAEMRTRARECFSARFHVSKAAQSLVEAIKKFGLEAL